MEPSLGWINMQPLPMAIDASLPLKSLITGAFHALFWHDYQTELVDAGEEPLYVPRSQLYPRDRIFFAKGYWASALHEISHWCLAGASRRRKVDYGYWYAPEGRCQDMQLAFQAAEVRPQALEWLFTAALAQPFFVSSDSFGASGGDIQSFRQAVRRQALMFLQEGLPLRGERFLQRLLMLTGNHEQFQSFWSEIEAEGGLPL